MSQPNQHGGYRRPANPAPVSGPGRMSRRTDGQPLQSLPDAAYGEQKTFRELQAGAPMSQASPQEGGLPITPLDTAGVVPLSAPSQHPDEPVTAGANFGPGAGAPAMAPNEAALDNLAEMLPTLEVAANSPSASPFFRSYVRMLRGMT